MPKKTKKSAKSMFIYIVLIFFGSLLGGCQNNSYAVFKEKGQAKIHALIDELKMIRTKDQLIERRHSLRLHFDDLANLHDQAKFYASNHPTEPLPPLSSSEKELSDLLRSEILRVYRLDGGHEIIDECRRSKNT